MEPGSIANIHFYFAGMVLGCEVLALKNLCGAGSGAACSLIDNKKTHCIGMQWVCIGAQERTRTSTELPAST